MSEITSWLISGLVVLLLVTFIWALISLRQLPLGQRPRTRTYNRLGQLMGVAENPDYHENPGEDAADEADVIFGSAPSQTSTNN
jgi:hypothetical protein